MFGKMNIEKVAAKIKSRKAQLLGLKIQLQIPMVSSLLSSKYNFPQSASV